MSSDLAKNSNESVKEQVEVLLETNDKSESSSELLPMHEWSSLILSTPSLSVNPKKKLYDEGLYSADSGEICANYIPQSNSSVFRHPYYNYPAVVDPGIKEALLDPIPPRPPYPDDGFKLYMDLCKEFNVCPVRLFYTNLLNAEINLSYYCLTSASVRTLAMALEHNEHVKHLDLTDNHLDLDACYHLGQMIKSNKTLEVLILDGCQIREEGLRQLGMNLNVNKTIKTLSLEKNNLTDDGGELFARFIDSGANFTRVNLSYNNLGVKTAYALVEALNFKNYLEYLDISWNPFVHTGSTVSFLKTLAATSENLCELNLCFMAFENVRMAHAIAAITVLPKLKFLNLSDNRFADDCAEILVSNLAVSNLRSYNLSNNLFSPQGACTILEILKVPRVKLRNLYLDNTCVNKTFMEILQDIRKMKNRKKVVVTFDKVLHDWVAVGDDPRVLILKRGEFIGKMKKKAPKDVPMFLLSLSHSADSIRAKELIVMMKHEKIPVNDDWVDGLIEAFPGPTIDKKPTVDALKMREFIRRIWPDLKLPPGWKPPIMIGVDVKNKKPGK